MASAAATPHPPTVVRTTTRLPLGSGWVAKVAAASNASSTVRARVIPAWRAMPVEDPVVAGQRTGVAGRRLLAAGGGPALDHDDRLAFGDRPHGLGEAPAVLDALDVGQADGGGLVVGVEVEVVGHGDRDGVPGRDAPAEPHTGLHCVVLEGADTKLPDWLATPILPAGGIGATIWAHSRAGLDTTPCPLGPATSMPSSSARASSSSWACWPSSPASPYPAEVMNAACTPMAAASRRICGLALAGVHRKTRSASPDGRSATVGTVGTPSTSVPSRLVANTRPE